MEEGSSNRYTATAKERAKTAAPRMVCPLLRNEGFLQIHTLSVRLVVRISVVFVQEAYCNSPEVFVEASPQHLHMRGCYYFGNI